MTVPLSQPIYENGTIMAESTQKDSKQTQPKPSREDRRQVRREKREQRQQGYKDLGRGNEHFMR